jgi:hypothetical protein
MMSALARAATLNRVNPWRSASREAGRADGKLKDRLQKEESEVGLHGFPGLASNQITYPNRGKVKQAGGAAGRRRRHLPKRASVIQLIGRCCWSKMMSGCSSTATCRAREWLNLHRR